MSLSAASVTGEPAEGLLTIDDLAAATGMTVRTTRYYASLGLIPAPVRRGRIAYYGPLHRARLEMIRALQDHGFTLQAIERYLADVPESATLEDLALRRAMLTSWGVPSAAPVSRRKLEETVGRRLSDDDLEMLQRLGSISVRPATTRSGTTRYLPMPSLEVGVGLLDLDIPVDAMEVAADAIERHMASLAEELTVVMRSQVLAPFHREAHSPAEAVEFQATVSRLRQLTLEAVVAGFQRAANTVIRRSLLADDQTDRGEGPG